MTRKAQALLALLGEELGINSKTVAKCRRREAVEGLRTVPKELCLAVRKSNAFGDIRLTFVPSCQRQSKSEP